MKKNHLSEGRIDPIRDVAHRLLSGEDTFHPQKGEGYRNYFREYENSGEESVNV